MPHFFLLYNYVPVGGGPNQLIYFDPIVGAFNPVYAFNVWPPESYLQLTATGIAPAPISLPANYANLIIFDPALWLNAWLPLVNTAYQNLYGIYPNLLTASAILPVNYVFTGSFAPPVVAPAVTPVVAPVVAPVVTPVVALL